MQLEEFIQMRIDDSLADGVTHVAEEFSRKYENISCVTIESLVDWQQDVHRKMQEAESFSLEHCYYWSLNSHLTDIILHAKMI